jgi:hypothetical protein
LSASAPHRGRVLAVWARVPSFERCGGRERAWWHLRHLQEAVAVHADPAHGIRVVQWLTQTASARSPLRGHRKARRRRKFTSGSGSGGGGALSGDAAETFTSASPVSPPQTPVDDEEVMPASLSPSSQVRGCTVHPAKAFA